MNKNPEQTDNQLVLTYKKSQDKAVLGQLYQSYMPLVYGVSLKYLKNREDAKDMAMQVFEKLMTSLLEQEVQNFKSWLYVLTKNECLMLLRKRNRQKEKREKFENEVFVEFDQPEHLSNEVFENDMNHLATCIEQLKAEQQKSIKLFFLEKKCYQEVSESTGFEVKKVKSYIQNGKRNLKLCIEKLREQA